MFTQPDLIRQPYSTLGRRLDEHDGVYWFEVGPDPVARGREMHVASPSDEGDTIKARPTPFGFGGGRKACEVFHR